MIRAASALILLALASCASIHDAPAAPEAAQTPAAPERLEAVSNKLDIKDGPQLRPSAWTLNPTLNPDVFTVRLDEGERREVCLISGQRSVCRTMGVGDRHDFVVSHAGVDYPTRFEGKFVPPMARFDAAYQAAHRGKTLVLIPEVYELVNVALALTPTLRENPGVVVKTTPYYADLLQHFAPMAGHPFVAALEAELVKNQARYFPLKMNGYAFEYDAQGRIVRSAVYDRTGFNGSAANDLLPMLELMRSFSDQSRFRDFYRKHQGVYADQIRYYEREVDVQRMQRWLQGNFPRVKPYDGIKIIFSPLVGWNQSLTTLENNGYRELQPHVNFPYPSPNDASLTPEGVALRRGTILFTEMNHGFINPTADPYGREIADAFANRDFWAVKGKASDGYGNPAALFLEMMNWALVSLYAWDQAPEKDRAALIANVETVMVRNRGFPQFAAFQDQLLKLYRERPAGVTLADLYPAMIAWAAEHQKAAPAAPAA